MLRRSLDFAIQLRRLAAAHSSVAAAERRKTAEQIGQRISTVLDDTKRDMSETGPDHYPSLGIGSMLGWKMLDSESRRRNWAWLEDQK